MTLCYNFLKKVVARMEQEYGSIKVEKTLIKKMKKICAIKEVDMQVVFSQLVREYIEKEKNEIMRYLDE
jgi:hypothetical protein